jgi:hypothetical protein
MTDILNTKTEMHTSKTPKFAWITLIILGIIDLIRGILHTIFVEFAAIEIMGLDLTHSGADQIILMTSFGASNLITGIIFILIGLKARHLSPIMLTVIPLPYFLVMILSRIKGISTQGDLGGLPMLTVYLIVSFTVGVISLILQNKNKK